MFNAVERKTRILRRILDHDWDAEPEFSDWIWHSTSEVDFELLSSETPAEKHSQF